MSPTSLSSARTRNAHPTPESAINATGRRGLDHEELDDPVEVVAALAARPWSQCLFAEVRTRSAGTLRRRQPAIRHVVPAGSLPPGTGRRSGDRIAGVSTQCWEIGSQGERQWQYEGPLVEWERGSGQGHGSTGKNVRLGLPTSQGWLLGGWLKARTAWNLRVDSVMVAQTAVVGLQAKTTQHRRAHLRTVWVRPILGHVEHELWDRVCAWHYYLLFNGLIGRDLRQAATLDGKWLATDWAGRQ